MAIKTIKVSSKYGAIRSYVAYAAITPGHLVEVMTTGKVRVHANAGQNAQALFALEDDLQGAEIDTAYSASDEVSVLAALPGDRINALLANGENASIGSFLQSNGDGQLKVHTATNFQTDSASPLETSTITFYAKAIVARAVVALNMSDSSGADPASQRFIVEVV